MFRKILEAIACGNGGKSKKKIRGTVVLMKKNVLDFNDFNASVLDRVHELLGEKVSLQLVSAVHADPTEKGLRGKLGKPAYLEDWITTFSSLTPGDTAYEVEFDWQEDIGIPGAFIITNLHHGEFYLKTLTLQDVPGHGRIHFVCNSWVYPAEKYKSDRVFFTNQTYLPSETPAPLIRYRAEELVQLRGNGTGKLEEWDRVYDYAYYNDLGDPDRGSKYARPVLGGSSEYPYPRRGRTGRPPTDTDPETESRLQLLMSLEIYVPRDERFGHLKMSDFLAYGLKSIVQVLLPAFEGLADSTPNEFDSFNDMMKLYGGFKLPGVPLLDHIKEKIPLEFLKELLRTDGEGFTKYPMPQVIKDDKSAWRTDKEFAREMVAGMNPVIISRLQEFPPTSKLDPKIYGNQSSSISRNDAIKTSRLFILNHHDTVMPYLRRINSTSTKMYATRTLLSLQNDGTLKPLAIELSLPHPKGDQFGAISKVYTPAEHGVEGSIWQLAKAYAAVNDTGVHQLISHWLNTHAAIEPFVIATNRQLSVLHPIYKLLHPHFRDTMNINAFARQILINGGGLLEETVFPGRYAMEMSSLVYKNWVFPEQALPADLIKRGMAVKDTSAPHGLRLLIKDYPYAVDGLKIWSAIETWVKDYCNFYYKSDGMVQEDTELQSWWKELREEGHGDKKNEPWWPRMQSRRELIESCTIIVWIASALHAATYLPSRTPPALQYYRGEELVNLRGTGTGELEESDRVYDYDLYNDLGNPDNANHVRPILGGSTEFPYPRRGRTGRPPSKKDPRCETRLPFYESLKIYVPRDERFSHLKMSDFAAYALQSIFQFLIPEFEALFDRTPSEFDTFEDVLKLYEEGIPIPNNNLLESIREKIPFEMIKELLRSDRERPFKFQLPQVIKEDRSAWRTDEEFAREMLAGVNPVVICGLKEFPPTSKLDPKLYGNQNSSMTKEHIKDHLDGLTVDEAMENNRLFILDHHEALMPYLRQINTTSTQTYATRTLLFLKRDGTLTPLAIELSLPHDEGDQLGAVSRVQTPAEKGAEGTIWQLAKAYVAVNDSGYHQLVCHWLHTHAVIEPFIIATNRQLSVLHPVYKLLHPHFRDTMNINALGRQTLINAGGILERTVFPGKFAMEISAVMYRDWGKHSRLILSRAVNFGQYPYGGYPLNRPAMSRRLIPEHGTPEYDELEQNPEKAYLKTITAQMQSILGISLIEILSKHSSDEVFLGQRDTSEWTTDMEPLKAFGRFGKKLEAIEKEIMEMNKDERYGNRFGPVQMPYTLLQPSHELGLTGKGIPNSVSI
ncbi:hypothetical protein RJ639_020401 [Escallonia herrerae]|uniref:Lipoxygenase n=1 Tax=Escallonia herrerae TaxID=1293975 RepID=A0AA89AFD9_9ASTE|nr:hypothetical protein RJ639_020401 [Escallonia herrerae]